MLHLNHFIVLSVGVCMALSACSPREGQHNQFSHQSTGSIAAETVAQTALNPVGMNNKPLYQGAITSQQLSATMLPVASDTAGTMGYADNIATGSISPQTSLQPTPNIYQNQNNINYSRASETLYTVQSGDTIYSIGRKFNVHPGEIIARNNIVNPNNLVVGQSFKVPTNGTYTANIAQNVQQAKVPVFPQTAIPTTTQNNISQSYIVQSGDTIYSIGRKFNINPTYIINKNPTINPNQLVLGQVLNISQNQQNTNVININKPVVDNSKNIMGNSLNNNFDKQNLSNALSLPVQGAIKENKNLRGILISASDGDAVKASATGEVIYVGNLNNYGNMILVRHDNGLVTNYARLKKVFVQKGQKVNKGDLIASAGISSEFNTSDVLFEVRKGTQAVNPLDYIG